MSEGIIGLETLDDIGEAIQYVEGSETTYTPGAMAQAIRGMKRTLVPKTATSNGVYSPILDDADGYSEFTVQVPGITPTGTVNINQNGTVDVTQYANAAVDVTNSYTAADEGKVVSSGALVPQTARTVITKGSYDTTTNNSVIVDTPDPGEVLAKLGSASQTVKLSGQYGPMVSGTDNYITPVDHYGEIATIDTTEPFEVGIRFKISQAVQAITYVLGAWDYDEDSDVRDLPLLFIGATGKLRYYLYSGSASDPTITQGGFNDMAAQVGAWITLGMAWDGTDMVLTASDGTTTETVTVANFTPVQTSAALPCFGAGGGAEANHLAALAGSYVDIAGCYIKQDGALVWGNENSGGGGGSGAVIQPLTATQNGTYTPPSGVDGFAPVVVNVAGGGDTPVLPSAYQRVEYMVFSGAQWFPVPADFSDTSITPTLYTKSAITSDFPSRENAVVGSGPTTGSVPEIYYNSSKGIHAEQMARSNGYFLISRDSSNILLFGSSAITVQYEQVTETLSMYDNKALDHINVGCYRDTHNYPFVGRIYRVWFGSDTGTASGDYLRFDYFTKLVDLIPCYRKSDNEPGFYDVVNSVFYTNQGTGALVAGPDAN